MINEPARLGCVCIGTVADNTAAAIKKKKKRNRGRGGGGGGG